MEENKPKRQVAAKKTAKSEETPKAPRKPRATKNASASIVEGAPEKKPRAPRTVKAAATPIETPTPTISEQPAKAKGKQVAPKKESAGAASNRKSRVSVAAKPIKKKKSDTPFWAPFAKKEKPKPDEERHERSERKRDFQPDSREERPSRSASNFRKSERGRTPKPRKRQQ